jgi:anti-sigma factor RsiW
MKCEEVRETMPDLAAGLVEPSGETVAHLQACAPCSARLQELRHTMALLDEWEAPEPSEYFDTRLQARLREEKTAEAARGHRGWFAWLPHPALAIAAACAIVVGVGIFRMHNTSGTEGNNVAVVTPVAVTPVAVETESLDQRGTAVGDLQTLESDNDLYADFDVLDDIDSQQNAPTSE